MKSYTDLPQSKKLVDILPIESADMYYCYGMDINTKKWEYDTTPTIIDASNQIDIGDIPCWSFAALLNVLPNNENISTNLSKGGYIISNLEYTNNWFVDYEDETNILNNCSTSADNPIDACYKMILKLNELKIL